MSSTGSKKKRSSAKKATDPVDKVAPRMKSLTPRMDTAGGSTMTKKKKKKSPDIKKSKTPKRKTLTGGSGALMYDTIRESDEESSDDEKQTSFFPDTEDPSSVSLSLKPALSAGSASGSSGKKRRKKDMPSPIPAAADPVLLEHQIRELKRENQRLDAELTKMKASKSKKMASLDREKEMRLQANQDKYWLQQKLSRMQMAIQARLKMLGIDFSECSDLGEALDAAFQAINKLSAQLAAKEKELAEVSARESTLITEKQALQLDLDKTKSRLSKATKENHVLKKKTAHLDKKLSTFGHVTEDLSAEKTEFETLIDDLNEKMKKQRLKHEEQYDAFMTQKEQMEQDMEQKQNELDDALKKLERLMSEKSLLQNELESTQGDLADQKKKNRRLMKDFESMDRESTERYEENQAKIKELQAQLQAEKDDRTAAEAQLNKTQKQLSTCESELARLRAELDALTKKSSEESMEMSKMMEQSKAELTSRLQASQTEKDSLKDLLSKVEAEKAERDSEIEALLKKLADVQKKYDDLINKPMDDKQTQTELDSSWFADAHRKIALLDRMREDYTKMGQQVADMEAKVHELHDENKVLLDEIDYLLKQGAKFRADTGTHSGGVHDISCSPCHYVCATTASDCSVRLWKTEPAADGGKSVTTLTPYAAANPEGDPLCVQFSPDGSLLAAGLSYKKGPDGAILVWDLSKGYGEVEYLFRSRPTVRFGIVHCLTWTPDNRYIFTGDTTGAVWVWDTKYMLQVAQIAMHKDIVHNLQVTNTGYLFSCSLDQNISMFELDRLKKIKIRPDRLHLWKPKTAKSKKVNTNERYPYWKLAASADGSVVYAGARKIWGFNYNDELKELSKGPRFLDSDTDHIASLVLNSNCVAICRRDTNHCKLFDMYSGKEVALKKFKTVVRRVGLVHDDEHMVCVLQIWEGAKKRTKPAVKLVKI